MPTLLDFVVDNFVSDDGIIPAVIGRNKNDIITSDRRLIDISLAIISLKDIIPKNKFKLLNNSLNSFFDSSTGGYSELLDPTGSKQLLGNIRTFGIQAIALLAELYCETTHHLEDISERLIFLYEKFAFNDFPKSLSENYEDIVISDKLCEEISLFTISACTIFHKTDGTHLKYLIENLNQLLLTFYQNGRIYDRVYNNGKPDSLYGTSLKASCLFIIARCMLKEVIPSISIKEADDVLLYIKEHHFHHKGSGFWNRTNAQGEPAVDPIVSIHSRHDSPFPAKLLSDHALLSLAAKSIIKFTKQYSLALEIDNSCQEEIEQYTDPKYNGVFLGQGSWFSTPLDPTVPLGRHVMVSPRTPGSFVVGNTTYVPFHEKHADVQFITLLSRVKNNRPAAIKKSKNIKTELSHSNIDKSWKPLVRKPENKISDYIDIESYLHWSQGTKCGAGYGLTPYKSPLSLRSDRTPQTFSVLHVVADQLVLGNPVEDPDKIINFIKSTQNDDGGFGEQAGLPSECFTTYCAVLTSKMLGQPLSGVERERCIEFIASCQRYEGGFGNAPGYPPDCWHSNLAGLALAALETNSFDKEALINYIVNCQNSDGGYGNKPGLVSDAFATFRAVSVLHGIGYLPPNIDNTVLWLKSLQTDEGGFRYRNESIQSFVGSYHAIAALYILDSAPNNIEKAKIFISSRQAKDGGFSRQLDGPSETTDEGFIAIQALHMLTNSLSKYWSIMIT